MAGQPPTFSRSQSSLLLLRWKWQWSFSLYTSCLVAGDQLVAAFRSLATTTGGQPSFAAFATAIAWVAPAASSRAAADDRPTDRPTDLSSDLGGDQVRQIAVESCCYYLRAPETNSSLLSGEGKHRERTSWRMGDSLKKFEAVVAVVFFRSWRTLRFLGEIRGRSGCFSSLSYPPRSFLLKQERKKEKYLVCLLLSSLLACMGEVTWMLHQALFQSQFHWRYLWILLSTWSWSFLVYLEGMLSSTNILPSRKGQVFGFFKMACLFFIFPLRYPPTYHGKIYFCQCFISSNALQLSKPFLK